MSDDVLTGQTVELLQHMIRNQCVNDGTVQSGQEVRTSDLLRASVEAPNRLCTNSTASSAVRLRTSSAGLISTTSSEPSWPVSAIISMHNWISR